MFKKNQGLTIIEVLIALALLSIIVFVVFDVFKLSFKLLNITANNDRAIYFAQELLEGAKGKSRQGLNPQQEVTEILINENMLIQYRIESINLDIGLQQIKVIVEYDQDIIILETRVGCYGP